MGFSHAMAEAALIDGVDSAIRRTIPLQRKMFIRTVTASLVELQPATEWLKALRKAVFKTGAQNDSVSLSFLEPLIHLIAA